ncbi:MAG: trypsin-like peptidase domain-containing protein [bacterium]
MKNRIYWITTLFLFLSISLHAKIKSGEEKTFPPIAMINHVEFTDSTFNNPIAGCSFLLDTGNEILAVTCKHSLWVAKSDTMKYINFEGTLKEWRMQRKDDSTKYLITDKLLNENREELIGEQNVNKDFLVFTIKENHCDVTPVKLRKTKLTQGEELYLVGWSFADKTGPQRIYKAKYFKSIESHILIEHADNSNLAGMSGGAVLDKDGLLVGIVSNYTFDDATQKWYGSPCSTEYLLEVLKSRTK